MPNQELTFKNVTIIPIVFFGGVGACWLSCASNHLVLQMLPSVGAFFQSMRLNLV